MDAVIMRVAVHGEHPVDIIIERNTNDSRDEVINKTLDIAEPVFRELNLLGLHQHLSIMRMLNRSRRLPEDHTLANVRPDSPVIVIAEALETIH